MSVLYSEIQNRIIEFDKTIKYGNYLENEYISKNWRIKKYGDRSYFNPYYWAPVYYDINLTILCNKHNYHIIFGILWNSVGKLLSFDNLIKKLEEEGGHVKINVRETTVIDDLVNENGQCGECIYETKLQN